jgi:hypothetical protein
MFDRRDSDDLDRYFVRLVRSIQFRDMLTGCYLARPKRPRQALEMAHHASYARQYHAETDPSHRLRCRLVDFDNSAFEICP